MQALILATDEQRRLSPLSDTLPGPMIPIIDRPVMATSVEILARAGQKRILVSLFERGGQIAAYFGSGGRWGVDLRYVTQRQALGTAGSLRFAGGLLNTTFLVLPGEALIDLDVEEALAFHHAHGGMATAIVHTPLHGNTARLARITPNRRLIGIGARADQPQVQLTGAYIFEPDVLSHIPQRGACDIATDLLPALIAAGVAVYGYNLRGYWSPMDSLAAFQEAQEVYLYSSYRQPVPEHVDTAGQAMVRFASLEARQIAPGIWVGRDHSIHPSVKIAPPVYIGPNSWIGREVELGPMAVVGANVVIDDEATIMQSTVLRNTYVGQLVRLDGRIVTGGTVSDPEAGVTTRVVDPFLLGRVDASAASRGFVRRVGNFLAALLLIVLLSPLLLLAGLLAFIGSRGRPIVRSPRVGQHIAEEAEPRTFQLFEFQTRRPGGEYSLFGQLLERWELDRLPALLNVLFGDMALVGVKPLRPEENACLTEEWHQRRHESPAGFTGLWFLQTSTTSSLDAVIVTDVYYTATRTWHGDLLILLRTPGAWIRRGRKRNQAQYADEESQLLARTEGIERVYTD